ncbi:BfmA/BtgA family mobilization protein [uncultured Croceitalea sp.]|uniref:BfmA/BtgA family mobilization protein n=1 Tax=uncultured Croceitalea sp. TaxID=1798908 RepID=UPI00330619E1
MELKKKKKSDFSAISINRITAGRYREFSKKISKSHTLTLELMMDFFEGANISPKNKYLMNHMGFEHRLNKRFDYIEELLRRMEKEQLRPTHDKLKKFFEYAENEERDRKESLEFEKRMFEQSLKKDRITQYDNYMLKENWKKERNKVLKLLNKAKLEKPRFGKAYFKLDIEQSDLESLKETLNKKL